MSFNLGDCLTLLCAFLFACHIAFLGAVSGITSSAAVLSVVQLGVSALLSMIAFCVIDQARCTLKAFCSGILPMLYLATVSYTHLDVYKRQNVERSLEVGHRDALVDHHSLKLVEKRGVGRVHRVGAVDLAGGDDPDGRLAVLHRADLHRRGLGARCV